MNKTLTAMVEMMNIDEMAKGNSYMHRRHPLVKFVVVIVYIFAAVSFDITNLSALIPMILFPVIWYSMADIPISVCFYKLRYILPIILAVGIWNPILNREVGAVIGGVSVSVGMISLFNLMLKSILALLASFILVATTGIDKICYGLRLLHVPEMLVTLLLITFRYITLLLDESDKMTNAYKLRAPNQKGIHYSAWGSFLGQLILRTMDRAQELYQSMKLRGYNGNFYYAKAEKAVFSDYIFLILNLLFIIVFRLVNISELVGKLFVR